VKGPKTESGIRDIWLTEETQLQLMGQLEFIRDRARRVRVPLVDDPFLWSFSPTCGVPPTPSSITHAFGATCKRAGVVGVRFHDLRHMYATLGIKAGKAITTLSRQLGHSNPRTTLAIYSHWEKQALAEVSDWVDDVLRPKTPELEA
jgi:integrase